MYLDHSLGLDRSCPTLGSQTSRWPTGEEGRVVQGTGRVAEKGLRSWWGDGMARPEAHRRGRQPDEAAGPSPSQYEEKDKAFKEQLSHLATLLPTLQVHLVICSSFLSLASKAEFLDLGYVSLPSSCGVSHCRLWAWQPVTWTVDQGISGLTSFRSSTPSSTSHLGTR